MLCKWIENEGPEQNRWVCAAGFWKELAAFRKAPGMPCSSEREVCLRIKDAVDYLRSRVAQGLLWRYLREVRVMLALSTATGIVSEFSKVLDGENNPSKDKWGN